jgi:hypothetical protein
MIVIYYLSFKKNMSLTVDLQTVLEHLVMQILNNLRTQWKICFKTSHSEFCTHKIVGTSHRQMQMGFCLVTIYMSSFLTSFLADMPPFYA